MAYETESTLINGSSNNTALTADPLTGGVQMKASLAESTDLDYFAITTDGAALISLDFLSPLTTTNKYWQVRLLDGNGDYLRTLGAATYGAPLVNGGSQSGDTLAVDGLTSLPATGSKFTLVTSNADTVVYTVAGATALSSGGSTLTLDKTLSATPADNTAISFDPAQSLTGVSTNLTATVSAAGNYYVEVLAGEVYSGSDYSITATVVPTTESESNNTKEDAVSANNRLQAGVAMTGALSSATDVDYWVFTTANASDFAVSFASSVAGTSNEWKIDVTEWSGATLPSNAGALQAGSSASVSIDDAVYANPTTFLVKVSAASSTVFNTGVYTLKVSGTGLNLNDAPELTVGTVTNATPYALVHTGVERNIPLDSAGVALTSLFSVNDPDNGGQTVASYKFSLTKAADVTSNASIRVGTEGSYTYYGFGTHGVDVPFTAAQMATATFLPGTSTGALTLALQAFDSTNAADDSGASAILDQTLNVVAAGFGVTTTAPGALTLSEHATGEGSSKPHSTTFTMSLTEAPDSDVKIYLTDVNNQLDLSAAVLTFTSVNWATPQTVTATATADGGYTNANQTAALSFQVVSTDATYDGFVVQPLAFTVSDNAPPVLATPTAISYTDTDATDTFSSPTSGSTTGTLSATDANTGDTITYGIAGGTDNGATVSKIGTYGTLTVTKADGSYTFAPNANAMNGASTNVSGTYTVTATDATAGTGAQATVSKDFTVNIAGVAEAAANVDVLAYAWKSHVLLDGVSVGFTGATGQTTANGGAASFGGVNGTTLDGLSATLTPDGNAGTAVNLQDAIAILKMIVGLDVNGAGKPLSPYQAIAADYDASGAVNLTDAIAVLKHVVGLTAPDPAWVFLNEAESSVPAMAAGLSGKTPPALSADVTTDTSVGLVGVLRGDVDGSWTPAATGSLDLDTTQPTYFTGLVQSLNTAHSTTDFDVTQWGIYS